MKAAVIGDGGWGTALARVLNANGHNVTVWGPFEEYVAQVARTHENSNFLPGVELSPEINWTSDHDTAVRDAELIVLATPTKFFVDVCSAFSGKISPTASVVSVAKGLCAQTHRRMSELAAEILEHPEVAALSGPSHAEEVARDIPTAVVIASRNPQLAQTLQRAFSNPRFRVYTSDDPIGVELGGALKNVIAIAVGASDGLGFGDNTKAALMTRGIAEITRLGAALGAQPETFMGLSGIGDLMVTCMSQHSRNRGVGERLGKGETLEDIMGSMKMVAEGVWNCQAAKELAEELGVSVPITEQVNAVVHEGKDPRQAMTDLMARAPKPEGQ